jgi:hypothetical protein
MRVPAAFSTAVRPVLTGPIQPAEWLGASPWALYLITRSGAVLAIVTHEAVRLPCGVVLASTAAELPLTELVPEPARRPATPASVGAGRIEWTGPSGIVTVAAVREWAPPVVVVGPPLATLLDALSAAVAERDIGVDADRVARLSSSGDDSAAQFAAVAGLLGRGPGLTPSGDDVVAGFLLGARAFGPAAPNGGPPGIEGGPPGKGSPAAGGVAATGATAAVDQLTAGATTALSAQLLRHAARGECVAQVAAVVAALAGRPAPGDAIDQLLAVGHTSGTALAAGLLGAAALSVSVGGGDIG